jgi:hypothetical protein
VYKHVLVEIPGNYLRGPYNPVPQVLGGSPIYSFLLVELFQLLYDVLLSVHQTVVCTHKLLLVLCTI